MRTARPRRSLVLLSPKVLPLAVASPFLCFAAAAQTAGDSVSTLGEVSVRTGTGGPLAPNTLLTSVDILGADKIENQNVGNSWELVGQLPGIQLTDNPHGRGIGQGHLPRLQRRGLYQRHQGADRRHSQQRQQRQPALHRHDLPAGDRLHRGGARHQRPALRPAQHRRQHQLRHAPGRRLLRRPLHLRQRCDARSAAGAGP